jgi:PAS domain S-box-containing protein
VDKQAITELIEESRRLRAKSLRLSQVSADIWAQIQTIGIWQVNDSGRSLITAKAAEAIDTILIRAVAERQDAEKTSAWLAAIIESSDDAIVSKDLNGVITSWNQGAERLFGYTAEEAVGQPINIIIPPERLDEEPGILDRIRRGERVDHYETVRRRKDGTLLDISLTISPVITADGQVIGASKIARDVTERKLADRKLRQSEERFRIIADSSPMMIWMTDRLGKAVFLNRSFREYFALMDEDVQGFSWFEAVHPDDREAYVAAFKAALLGQQEFQRRIRLRRYDGSWRWFESRGNLMIDEAGSRIGFIGSSTDITEIYESQQALKELDRRKDEFLATLSHELRNPLAPISNAVEILKTIQPAEPVVQWSRDLIDHQVKFLARLMEDLLDLNRITRGVLEVRKQPCDLRRVIDDALETSRPSIEAAGHQLTIALPAQSMELDADPIRLNQLFTNILNNATKYMDANGKIWLAARIENGKIMVSNGENEGDESPLTFRHVVVSIKDSGIGIESEMLPRLFDMFVQAESGRSRRFGGLGIGLTLARSIVELHGGSIQAASAGLGRGSEFTVRLPLKEELGTAQRRVAHSRLNPQPRRVLIVDDNENQVESMTMLLKRLGFEVRAAKDAWSALEILKEFVPEFAFIDIGLPGIDGFELARHIRATSELQNVLLIAATGWGREEDREQSRQSGFDYHLTKPIDFDLVEKILAAPSSQAQVMDASTVRAVF